MDRLKLPRRGVHDPASRWNGEQRRCRSGALSLSRRKKKKQGQEEDGMNKIAGAESFRRSEEDLA
jgi:hypothetical protein